MSARYFRITPSQYQVFRFSLPESRRVHIGLSASAAVKVLLLNSGELAEYVDGEGATHPYTAAWGRRTDLDVTERIGPGTWYVIVEGSTEASSGRLDIDV